VQDTDGPGLVERSRWFVAILLAIDVVLLLGALSLAHVTARGPSERALTHIVATLTEVDGYLNERFDALQQEAARSDGDEIAPAGFLLPVTFTPEEIVRSSEPELRSALLARSARLLRDKGANAFELEANADLGISPAGGASAAIDFLRPRPHGILMMLTVAFALAAAVLSLMLGLASRGHPTSVGVAVLMPSVPFLVVAVALRFALRLAAGSTEDFFAEEFLQLGQELTWAAIRNGLIFSLGAGVVLLSSLPLDRLDYLPSRHRPAAPVS
jgi:hypothetical protein